MQLGSQPPSFDHDAPVLHAHSLQASIGQKRSLHITTLKLSQPCPSPWRRISGYHMPPEETIPFLIGVSTLKETIFCSTKSSTFEFSSSTIPGVRQDPHAWSARSLGSWRISRSGSCCKSAPQLQAPDSKKSAYERGREDTTQGARIIYHNISIYYINMY